jgi:hypothetical protein
LEKKLVCFVHYEILQVVQVDGGMILDELD